MYYDEIAIKYKDYKAYPKSQYSKNISPKTIKVLFVGDQHSIAFQTDKPGHRMDHPSP